MPDSPSMSESLSEEAQPILPPPLPAHMGYRALALAMDAFLVIILASLIATMVTFPSLDADEQDALGSFLQEIEHARTQELPRAQILAEHGNNPILHQAFMKVILTVMLTFWAYFSLSEWWMHGTTLGKRMVSIRTIQLPDRFPPGLLQHVLRGGIKSMSLLALFALPELITGNPLSFICLLLVMDYAFAWGNPARRSLHCILTRTCVVEPTQSNLLDEIA